MEVQEKSLTYETKARMYRQFRMEIGLSESEHSMRSGSSSSYSRDDSCGEYSRSDLVSAYSRGGRGARSHRQLSNRNISIEADSRLFRTAHSNYKKSKRAKSVQNDSFELIYIDGHWVERR